MTTLTEAPAAGRTTTRGVAKLLALRTASPETVVPQQSAFDDYYREMFKDVPKAEEIFRGSGVYQRHMAWDPRTSYADGYPPIKPRMEAWQENVLAMSRRTVGGVLEGDELRDRIGTFVLASCTGYAGPTPDILLAKEFGLRQDLRRTFIGHMGCNAAFNVLKTAFDALAARPAELVLAGSAEVCSVHLRPEFTAEQAVVNALFGDAGAMTLLGADDGGPGPVFLGTYTETHPETTHAMSWHIEDVAFRMTLSPYVPFYLAESIEAFVKRLLAPHGLDIGDVRHWGVHPGGPKIIDFVGEKLALTPEQLAPSRAVLAEHGNCSSATILLILDRILRESRPEPGEHAVLMAFGPGLTMESALVRF
ncbi:type III polyketide synthase [Streptomyces yaanensis]|uniref:Type III polyketide synthase n=1 Tax=Streptomyces yaanensis TaxID=1142239 RepID=A0ABV7SHI5_9ACTN|nr:type III polyketide synthase [Streptomyces sp. CGMCC 4.7035]WNB99321.1 type III polyketide synthase [Streptomyces sp. CGMCC 4.7035]